MRVIQHNCLTVYCSPLLSEHIRALLLMQMEHPVAASPCKMCSTGETEWKESRVTMSFRSFLCHSFFNFGKGSNGTRRSRHSELWAEELQASRLHLSTLTHSTVSSCCAENLELKQCECVSGCTANRHVSCSSCIPDKVAVHVLFAVNHTCRYLGNRRYCHIDKDRNLTDFSLKKHSSYTFS